MCTHCVSRGEENFLSEFAKLTDGDQDHGRDRISTELCMPCTPYDLCKNSFRCFAEYFIVEAQLCGLDYIALQNIDFSFLDSCCVGNDAQNVDDSFF